MATKKTLRRRNLLHNHPLLVKGGAHEKTYKAKRRTEKMKIKKEWLPQDLLSRVIFGKPFLIIFNQ